MSPADSPALTDDALLLRAHQQLKLVIDAESDLRARMLEDYRFVDEDEGQWDTATKTERRQDGRPCLQIDRTSGQVRQVTNRILEARPAIQITPVDQGADIEKAEVRQGVIRYIEDESDAEIAYATGAEHQVKFGRGYWRIVPTYVDDESSDPARLLKQEPRILEVDNPFSVYCDPQFRYGTSTQPGQAMRFAFVGEDVDPDEYQARYDHEGPSSGSLDALRSTGDAAPDWFPRGKVHICEYFYVDTRYEEVKVGISTRRVPRRAVKWCLINAVRVIERRDVPGPYIPIIPVIGERTNIDGVIDLKGLVRRAKDPQRMVNYGRSKTVETEALAPSAPFIAAFGQTEAFEEQWKTANRRNWSRLVYDPISVAGVVVPPPQRNFGEPAIQALLGMSREFENDLRAMMQMPDVQGQELRREQSGKAIRFRELQSETGNSHFAIGLRRAIRLTGKILNAWIPVYFDVPTQLQIVGKDGRPQEVILHAGQGDAAQRLLGPSAPQAPGAPAGGQTRPTTTPPTIVDLRVGRYDVKVSTGPSYQAQREENRDRLGSILERNVELMPLIGDLFFENWDDPIGQQIAKRLKKANPMLAEESGEGPPPIPPEVQEKMAALTAQHEALTQTVEQLTQERDSKVQELAAQAALTQQELQQQAALKQEELALKRQAMQQEAALELDKARIKADTELEIVRMKLETERAIAALQAEVSAASRAAAPGTETST